MSFRLPAPAFRKEPAPAGPEAKSTELVPTSTVAATPEAIGARRAETSVVTPPPYRRVALPLKETVPVPPKAAAWASNRVPDSRPTPPPKVLAAASVNVPLPALRNPAPGPNARLVSNTTELSPESMVARTPVPALILEERS